MNDEPVPVDGFSNHPGAPGPGAEHAGPPDALRMPTLVFSGLFGFVLLILTVAAVATYVQNNARFNEWKDQLAEHSLPAGTTLVESDSRFGKLWGLGEHCDGEMWVVLIGDVSREQLEEHYLDITNVVAKRESEEPETWRVSVLRTHIGPAGLDPRCR